jgi:pimeloyl-ACP methyl ester carboxylesterase
MFCGDLDEATTKRLLEKAAPYPPRFVMDPVSWNVHEMSVPSLYVKLLKDQTVMTPKTQDRMISILPNAQVATLDTGHAPMLAQPKELAETLNRALI